MAMNYPVMTPARIAAALSRLSDDERSWLRAELEPVAPLLKKALGAAFAHALFA
jgi:hypothetical protein